MARAKGMQAEHWQAVFRDGVDRRFYDRATRIGNVHAGIGLEPKWYVALMAWCLNNWSLRSSPRAGADCSPGGERKRARLPRS